MKQNADESHRKASRRMRVAFGLLALFSLLGGLALSAQGYTEDAGHNGLTTWPAAVALYALAALSALWLFRTAHRAEVEARTVAAMALTVLALVALTLAIGLGS
jgi:cytochrome bd-type quinol oxidase subunit 2